MMGSGKSKPSPLTETTNLPTNATYNKTTAIPTSPKKQPLNSQTIVVFSHPNSLSYLHYKDLLSLHLLSQEHHTTFTDDEETSTMLWKSVCINFSHAYGLFLPKSNSSSVEIHTWRCLFAEDLWPARKKWYGNDTNDTTNTSQFKIKVSVRFRPEEAQDTKEKVALPLHQLLKLKRAKHKKNKKKNKQPQHIAFGGKTVTPLHLLDAMTHKLMTEPRKLPSSGKVMELQTLLKLLKRDPKDPFDGTPLRIEEMEQCPTIEKEIQAYHQSNLQELDENGQPKTNNKNHVSISAITQMAESNTELSPELLEMLMEADCLAETTKQLEKDAINGTLQNVAMHASAPVLAGYPGYPESTAATATAASVLDTNAVTHIQDTALISTEPLDAPPPPPTSPSKQNASIPVPPWKVTFQKRKKEKSKLLSIQSSRVNYYVPGSGIRQFLFPRCFDGNATQCKIYSDCARAAVFAALNGISSCILSFGQTGSGKTYSQFGPLGWQDKISNNLQNVKHSNVGCVVRGIVDVLDAVTQCNTTNNGMKVTVGARYIQIYNNEASDLMTNQTCTVRRDTGDIAGCTTSPIETITDALSILNIGEQNKRFAATAMNERSSRAHTIFSLLIHQTQLSTGNLVTSKLYFVDLAGSERVKKSKVQGVKLSQAIGINSSLMVLGKVIKHLVQGKNHIGYLESKLTTLLRSCFGGDFLTRVLVSCRSDTEHSDESLNSLRFGERCSRITNQVVHGCGSVETALLTIDTSIEVCDAGLVGLKARGLDTRNLQERRDLLVLKKKDLVKLLK